jgi:hypothetical protein
MLPICLSVSSQSWAEVGGTLPVLHTAYFISKASRGDASPWIRLNTLRLSLKTLRSGTDSFLLGAQNLDVVERRFLLLGMAF